jgi:hypothetical protein
MPHNIEKSGFRHGEYVGYGAGKVWRIRKTLFGGWKWAARVQGDDMHPVRYADTLRVMSKVIERPAAQTA